MNSTGNAFQSIESAHDFVTLLAETVMEAKRDVAADVQRESSATNSQRLDMLRMALYSLEKLEIHMTKSRHILDDLRSQHHLLSGGVPCSHRLNSTESKAA
jgi:phospholipid N-methyltransferase